MIYWVTVRLNPAVQPNTPKYAPNPTCKKTMPTISMFYGILVLMYFYDNKKHNRPHIHAEYGEYEASIAIEDGSVFSGGLPSSKLKLVQAWVEIDGELEVGSCRRACVQDRSFALKVVNIWIK